MRAHEKSREKKEAPTPSGGNTRVVHALSDPKNRREAIEKGHAGGSAWAQAVFVPRTRTNRASCCSQTQHGSAAPDRTPVADALPAGEASMSSVLERVQSS